MIKGLILRSLKRLGYTVLKTSVELPKPPVTRIETELKMVHYGAGGRILPGWVNIDLYPESSMDPTSMKVAANLVGPHPFRDAQFSFGFSEDFLEHLEQDQQLVFLVEAHRTLAPGGILRLSFPGLEGVLNQHYPRPDVNVYLRASQEAYAQFGHRHFPSREELSTIAKHIGFSEVRFDVPYGKSEHPELCALDSRSEQQGLNTYVELTR